MNEAYKNNPHLKVERANQHIAELQGWIRASIVADSKRIVRVENDFKTGELLVHYQLPQAVPTEFSIVAGDAIHNLKTALDWTWANIVRALGHVPDSHMRFPFRESRDQVISAIKGRTITEFAHADLYRIIVCEIQPYRGGNDSLWALDELDRADKHRLLIPMWDVFTVRGMKVQNNRGEVETPTLFGTRGRNMPFRFPAGYKLQDKGEPTFDIFFDQVAESEPVVPTLRKFAKTVERVIQLLAPFGG
jgi:hypothetical protein